MKKFISLMNSHTFYHLWENEKTKLFIENIIHIITNTKECYKLIKLTSASSNVRNYIILESNSSIIYIDFNRDNNLKLKLSMDIIRFLSASTEKEVLLIMFHDFKGTNNNQDNVFNIYKNETSIPEIKLFMSSNFKEQRKYDIWGIIDFLYNLDDEFYIKYLSEFDKEENIYNLFDL